MTQDRLRVVIDPNVYISALISPHGTTAAVVRAGLEGRYQLVVCPQLVAELDQVLRRPSFRRYCTEDQAREFVAVIIGIADTQPDPDRPASVTRDPDDDYLVALAATADAQFIVSGDDDLTGVDVPHAQVMTPRRFLDRLAR